MDEAEHLEPDSQADSGMKLTLRVASFILPSIVTIVELLHCWRLRFIKQCILGAGFAIAMSVYVAIFLYRRSYGYSARIFYVTTGPNRDTGHQDQTDTGVLFGAAIYVGIMAYMLIKDW